MKNKIPIIFIIIQIISFIIYLLPHKTHAHVPIGFMKLIIFGIFNLILITIFSIILIKTKKKMLIWKIPFLVLLILMIINLYL